MILLRTNVELKHTFERLVKTMDVPVEWTGMFAVIGDYLILQGKVRSLFFNFENKKVVTNIIELPIKEDNIIDIAESPKVQNVINIVLYAFGRWGTINGLTVEKNYAQINELFTGVLKEFYIDPEYTSQNFRFFKESIRIAYEDVVQLAIEAQEKLPEEPEEEKESRQGLWRKLIWKRQISVFEKVETTFDERQKDRLGNNFYAVGYACPACKANLHMVIFPENHEFRVETEEGGVLLARAYTCDACSSFFTPYPLKLLTEGDVFVMPFEDDQKAYEDYLELLGSKGHRTSNFRFNEFADQSRRSAAETPGEGQKSERLEELIKRIETMPDEEYQRFGDKIQEGFYPPQSVEKYGKYIKNQEKKRRIRKEKAQKEKEEKEKKEKEKKENGQKDIEIKTKKEKHNSPNSIIHSGITENQESSSPAPGTQIIDASGERNNSIEHYRSKLQLLDRLSENQCRELKSSIKQDKNLKEEDKQVFLSQIDKLDHQKRMRRLEKKAEGCEGKTYAHIKRCLAEIQQEDVPSEMKAPLFEKLARQKKEQGEREAAHMLSHMPLHMDLTQFRKFEQRLKEYQEVAPASYEDKIKDGRIYAEQQEVANLVRRTRKNSRDDYANLVQKLEDGGFNKEFVTPYIEKAREKVRQLDTEAIAGICENAQQMSFEEGMEAYQKIEEGLFLPELKTNALEMLGKRLAKIKTDECELLIKKFKGDLAGKIKENPRFHFYPARKILMGEAEEEDTSAIDCALSTYGGNRREFEYPILVVDTSKNESGKEGMILTPEHLLYSTFLNAYDIPISSIAKFKASTGLLNRGLTVELKNKTKIKLPYAVETGELLTWASSLKDFVQYLQEKPQSRSVTYLAKEKHETICCFRCGYLYKGGIVCPKCGYKNNK